MSDTATATPVRARRTRAEPSAPTVEPISPVPVVSDAESMPGPVSAQRARKPFGARAHKLDNSERPGFHRHWFNDWPGRIQTALEAGYTHVKDVEGKNMCRVVGTQEHGGGLTAYRMEIPIEWYNEDQAAKEAREMEKMEQIRRGKVADVVPGQDGAYVPMNKSGTRGADIRMNNRK